MTEARNVPVALEPLTAAHRDGAAALWGDPAVIRFTNVERPLNREEAAERLELLLAGQRGLPGPTVFAVRWDGRFCGLAGCPPVDAAAGVVGCFYQLLPAFWGRGAGRAAAELALTALGRLAPEAVVLADTVAENAASVRILEGLGFARTAVHPGALERDGVRWDVWDYMLRLGGREEECL